MKETIQKTWEARSRSTTTILPTLKSISIVLLHRTWMRGFCNHFKWKHSVLIFVGIFYSILNCKSVFMGIVPYLSWIQKVNDSDDIWHHILSHHLYSHKSPYDADRSDHVEDGDDPKEDEHPYRSVFHISVYLWYYSNMMKPWVAKL